jgi:hypothetical protein
LFRDCAVSCPVTIVCLYREYGHFICGFVARLVGVCRGSGQVKNKKVRDQKL